MDYRELVEKAKLKDEKAIEQLFELTSQKGYFVALKYLKNKEDAQDILQDSYVSAITKLDQLKDIAKFDKWLFQIIANKAKNFLVKNKPLLFEQLESDDEDAINFEETIKDDYIEFQPKENCDYQELKNALKILIDELPEDQRMCLLMYYFEELSITEIADSLELNTNTIKSRLNYARTKIKAKIEELQKKGTHLYSVSPIPFLLWMLLEEEKATAAPKITGALLHTQIAGQVATQKGIAVLGKVISTKVIVATTIVATTVLGSGIMYYNYSQEQERQDIYDSLSIQFADNNVFEYGDEFEESLLIKDYTGTIKSMNQIDMKKVGEQTLQYVVSKDGIERTFEVTVEIKDTKKPILNLTQEIVQLTVGDEFDPTVYIAESYDEVDGELKENVEIDNPVDLNVAGEYEVKYSLTDKNGLNSEVILKVILKDKQKIEVVMQEQEKEEPQEIVDNRQVYQLDELGLSMKVPANMLFSGVEINEAYNGYKRKTMSYVGSEPSLFGSEGMVISIHYYPFNDLFYNVEGSQGLRYYNTEGYEPRKYETYDRGSYILAYHQGVDYPISGSAWTGENDNESISIRVEGKANNSGVYAINVRVNNFDRAFSLGIDGFKEQRIQIARQIFDSIK